MKMAFSSAFVPARNEDATMRMLFANLFGMFTHYTLYTSDRVYYKWGQLLANPIGCEFVAIFIRWPAEPHKLNRIASRCCDIAPKGFDKYLEKAITVKNKLVKVLRRQEAWEWGQLIDLLKSHWQLLLNNNLYRSRSRLQNLLLLMVKHNYLPYLALGFGLSRWAALVNLLMLLLVTEKNVAKLAPNYAIPISLLIMFRSFLWVHLLGLWK